MATTTEKLGLILPDGNERVNVGQLNENFRKIDNLVGSDPQTVKNSDLLGGKPTEHYLPVVNLLDNPDFSIAQAGYGKLHGTERYAADRWFSWNCSIAVNGDIKTLTSTEWAFVQQVLWKDGRDLGKSFTLAITLDDDTVRLCSGTVTSSTSGETLVAETEVRPGVWVSFLRSSAGDFVARITLNHAGATVSFKHMRMFPGIYTAATLPPFVPRPYAVELLECQKYYRQISVLCTAFLTESATARHYYIDFSEPLRDGDGEITVDIAGLVEMDTWTSLGSTLSIYDITNSGFKLYVQSPVPATKPYLQGTVVVSKEL